MNHSNFVPNSFQVPNALVDLALAEISGNELKIYMIIVRKTKGWQKEKDAISLSQFIELAKLSKPVIVEACKSLVKKGLINKHESGKQGISVYSINMNFNEDMLRKLTSKENELVKKTTSTSKESLPKPVNNLNTQKYSKNNIQTKIVSARERAPDKPKKSELDILNDFGVTGELADDFVKHRKKVRATISVTAMKGFQREADKLGIPITEALSVSIMQGWRGFRAEWYQNLMKNNNVSNQKQLNHNTHGWLQEANDEPF